METGVVHFQNARGVHRYHSDKYIYIYRGKDHLCLCYMEKKESHLMQVVIRCYCCCVVHHCKSVVNSLRVKEQQQRLRAAGQKNQIK